MRFTAYGVYRLMFMRNYFGEFTYINSKETNLKEITNKDKISNNNKLIPMFERFETESLKEAKLKYHKENSTFLYFVAYNGPWFTQNINAAPKAKLDDGYCDIVVKL